MKKLMMLSMMVVAGAALTGCKPPPEGAYVAVAKPDSPEAAGLQVVLLNYDLTRTLAVDKEPVAARDSVGRLQVQAGLRNRTDNEILQLQAQALFFDVTGKVLYSETGSEAPWNNITISPNQTVYYTATALTTEAAKFTVRVRYTAKVR